MTERGPERSDANATYVFAVCWNPDRYQSKLMKSLLKVLRQTASPTP